MAAAHGRVRPNILITGTPGTGKTILGMELSKRTGMNFVNIGDMAKENNYYEGWDDERQCHVLNEDGVCVNLCLFQMTSISTTSSNSGIVMSISKSWICLMRYCSLRVMK